MNEQAHSRLSLSLKRFFISIMNFIYGKAERSEALNISVD
jgi:hypothetical protein